MSGDMTGKTVAPQEAGRLMGEIARRTFSQRATYHLNRLKHHLLAAGDSQEGIEGVYVQILPCSEETLRSGFECSNINLSKTIPICHLIHTIEKHGNAGQWVRIESGIRRAEDGTTVLSAAQHLQGLGARLMSEATIPFATMRLAATLARWMPAGLQCVMPIADADYSYVLRRYENGLQLFVIQNATDLDNSMHIFYEVEGV